MSEQPAQECVNTVKEELAKAGTALQPDTSRIVERLSDGRGIVQHAFVLAPHYTVARGEGCVGVQLGGSILPMEIARLLGAEGLPYVWSGRMVLWVFPAGT